MSDDVTERWRIGREVERMGEPDRTVMQMCYHAGRSDEDVARTLRTSTAVVTHIRQRALASIREAIGL